MLVISPPCFIMWYPGSRTHPTPTSSVVSKQMTDSNDRLPIRTVRKTLDLVDVKRKQHSCCSNIKVVTHQVTGCVLLLSAVTKLISSQENSNLLPKGLTWNPKIIIWRNFLKELWRHFQLMHMKSFFIIVFYKALNGREQHSRCLFIRRADFSLIMWMYVLVILWIRIKIYAHFIIWKQRIACIWVYPNITLFTYFW